MFSSSISFFGLALVSAVLGFTGIAMSMAWLGQMLFVVFTVLFVMSLFVHGAQHMDDMV